MYEQSFPEKRFQKTLKFLENHISRDERILDLGVPNPFSKIMEKEGFLVNNTKGEDLDDHFRAVQTNS